MHKPIYTYFAFLSLVCCLALSSCLKDKCTHTSEYKIYTPVYASMAEIRQEIKPEAPRALENTGKIYYHNGYLLINELNKGIHIIDDRNTAAPQNIGFISVPGNIDMAVKGNILYVDSYLDMVALDISNPLNAKVASRVENVFPPRRYGYSFSDQPNGNGIITGFVTRDTVIENDCDIHLNTNGWVFDAVNNYALASSAYNMPPPTTAPNAVSVGGSMARFATYRDFLYTVQGSELKVYDISQPAVPDSTTIVNLQQTVETIFPYSHYLFIGSPIGMLIYDVTDPKQPTDRKNFSHFYSCDPVVVQDEYAYVTLRMGAMCGQSSRNELNVVNVKNMNNISLQGILELTNPHGLSVDGRHLMVCDGKAGVRFIDVSEPTKPKIITTIGNIEAYDAIALNGLLIVTAKDGIYQFDYSNYNHPKLVSKISTSLRN